MRTKIFCFLWMICSLHAGLSAYTQSPVKGRVKIRFEGFKCLNPTTDDMLQADGKGDEVLFSFIYGVSDSNGRVKYKSKISTKTYGDINGYPGRIQAGTLSPAGGITQADFIYAETSPGSDPAQRGTLVADRPVDPGDIVFLFPVIWEWDHTGVNIRSELEAFLMNSMDSIARKTVAHFRSFPAGHRTSIRGLRASNLIDTNRVRYILRNVKDKPGTRPVGISSTGSFPNFEMLVLAYDKDRIPLIDPFKGDTYHFIDDLFYDPLKGQYPTFGVGAGRLHPNGDYLLTIRAEYQAPPQQVPPAPVTPPVTITPPRPIRDSVPGRINGDTLAADTTGSGQQSIVIGNLRWMRENLRTTVYNDGTPIKGNFSNKEWEETREGAYAIYENNPQYDALYGKLYNGYAVMTGKLCPPGWRIPTDNDWQQLEKSLGMSPDQLALVGGRGTLAAVFKEPGLWDPSGHPNSNSSGFSVRPAGIRSTNGDFMVLKQYGDFWTSTIYENPYALFLWNRHFYYNSSDIGRNYLSANNGYSCRCVQDVK